MNEALTVREMYRAGEWTAIIRQCRESGLSNKQFCLENDIPESKFYYWLKKLRKSAVDAVYPPELVPLDLGKEPTGSCENQEDDYIHIQFGMARMDLPPTIDIDALSLLLRSVQETWST